MQAACITRFRCVLPRRGRSARRTALLSRPGGSGEPSYGATFPRLALLAASLLPLCGLHGRAAEVQPPGGQVLARVDFERHVMGVLGRTGCNSGSCHGSFQGKGGFRLSLFGYDPEKDYLALTREGEGRRIHRVDPDRSLHLHKATGQVPHGGLVRFGRDS